MRSSLLLALAFVFPGQAGAQPYSESMADCAAFYQNAAQWVRQDDNVDRLIHAARQFHAAALRQSAHEGQPTDAEEMWRRIDTKTTAWEARGALFPLSEEFRDWASYCRKFARHTGTEISF